MPSAWDQMEAHIAEAKKNIPNAESPAVVHALIAVAYAIEGLADVTHEQLGQVGAEISNK